MRRLVRLSLAVAVAGAALIWNGNPWPSSEPGVVATAQAVIGRPLTPISYAGVARRTTRRAVAVAGPGVGVNMGGPVNRVGRW